MMKSQNIMQKEHSVILSMGDTSLTFDSQHNCSISKGLLLLYNIIQQQFEEKTHIKSAVFLLLFFMKSYKTIAQRSSVEIESEYLSSERNIHLEKCTGFDSTKPYQLFVILDEPVLFDYTVSVLSYLSIWKEIPQYVAIGIPNQDRWKELQPKKGEAIEETPFFKFMQNELESISYVKNASFRTLIGHSLSARFALQFFFRNHLYSAVIGVSPPLIPQLQDEFCDFISNKKNCRNSYIYMCSSDQDLRFHKKHFLETKKKFKSKKNPNLMMEYFKNQRNTSHSLMPLTAIQNGLVYVLDDFFNLPSKGVEKHTSKKNVPDSLLEYSYKKIHEIYGVTPEFRSVDFQSFVDLYVSKSNFSEAHRLCDLYIERTTDGEVYDLIDAFYLKGLTFEEEKSYQSALEFYLKGYSIIPEEVLNKADFKEDIVRLERILAKSKKNTTTE